MIDPRVKLCSVLSFKDRRGKTLFKDMHTQKVIHGRKIQRRIVAIRRAKLKWLAQQYSPAVPQPKSKRLLVRLGSRLTRFDFSRSK